MHISPVYQTEYICGECHQRGSLCCIITADNNWRFIVCEHGDQCFNNSIRGAREIDNFWRMSPRDKLRYFNSAETEDSYTKERLRAEYHTKVQDEVLLSII
jgi:transcription elongation factor Elf1